MQLSFVTIDSDWRLGSGYGVQPQVSKSLGPCLSAANCILVPCSRNPAYVISFCSTYRGTATSTLSACSNILHHLDVTRVRIAQIIKGLLLGIQGSPTYSDNHQRDQGDHDNGIRL